MLAWAGIVAAAPTGILLTSALVLTTQDAAAQSAVVREIRVEGNRRMEAETVRSYMRINVGDRYDEGKVDDSVRALFSTGLFSDVRINLRGTTVVVAVVENPVVNQVAFEGNSEVDKATLETEVQLKPRSVFTRSKAQADVQRILDVYRRQGRFAAAVQPKLIELDNGRVNVVFEINEGQATKVKSIQFVGNRAFTDSQLRDIISTTQSGWFDFLKGTNIYDPDRLSLDKELLRQYYLKNGYAEARVVSANAELDRDGSGFFITFVVEEGDLYNFGAVSIESKLPAVDTKSLEREILSVSGKTFNLQQIDKTVEAMTLAINGQGFAFGRVRPRTDRDAAARAINLVYVIDEGPRIYVERININGNQRTHDYVIRREFKLAEGDAYNPLLVETAKKRITNLGFFKSVDIKRRQGSSPDRVVLDVDVVEQSTGDLSFGAGYSSAEGVIGDVSITERNLLGRGQYLRFGVAGSRSTQNFTISFTEPRFLGTNIAAGFDLFHKNQTANSYTPYNTTSTGGSVRASFPLSEQLWLNTSYTLSRTTIDIPTDYQTAASLAIKQACGFVETDPLLHTGNCTEGAYITSSVSVGFVYDTRNHPKTPTRGVYVAAGTDLAGLGGDVHYARFNAEARGYYPITEKITLVGRVAAGHIMGWNGDDVKLLDLFYRGGETIRGFNRLGYGPRDLASTNQDALGGTTHWVATAEVRFPLPFLPDELGMSGAVFADAGSLFGLPDNVKSIAPGAKDDASVRSSIGIGLLWNSPLGPLRLDYAKALTKTDYDKEQSFRFGAQTKF